MQNASETARCHIMQWILTSVQVPRAELGGFAPCPFARGVVASDAMAIHAVEIANYKQSILDATMQWDDKQQIVVFCALARPSLQESQEVAQELNERLNPLDLIVLLDHPDDDFTIRGVRTGNGKYVLFLVQKLGELNEASEKLHANTDYYANWSPENIEKVLRLPGRISRKTSAPLR